MSWLNKGNIPPFARCHLPFHNIYLVCTFTIQIFHSCQTYSPWSNPKTTPLLKVIARCAILHATKMTHFYSIIVCNFNIFILIWICVTKGQPGKLSIHFSQHEKMIHWNVVVEESRQKLKKLFYSQYILCSQSWNKNKVYLRLKVKNWNKYNIFCTLFYIYVS